MSFVRIMPLFLAAALSAGASIAAPLSCADARTAVSTNGEWTELRVSNDGDEALSLVWTDQQGRDSPRGEIAPHAAVRLASYVGHVWSLKTMKGDCVCAMRLQGRTRWVRAAGACRETLIPPFEPTANYQVETIEGWRVWVSSDFANHSAERVASIDALRADLAEVVRRVPAPAVPMLRETKIWLEYTDDLLPDRSAYHPYLDYLVASGLNPDKVRSAQFTARSLESRPRQPAMVLHELAHAFHDQVLGYDDPAILAAYFHACADTRLFSVEKWPGHPERHYGLNDQTEFFAEFTEAYFWENDYPPKTRDALTAFDPLIADVILKSWSKPRAAQVHLGAPQQVCPKK